MKTATREKPVIFSGPMVKAILEGRKTQTRRVCDPQPEEYRPGVFSLPRCVSIPRSELSAYLVSGQDRDLKCPYGRVGSRLWVREKFRPVEVSPASDGDERTATLLYAADGKRMTVKVGEYTGWGCVNVMLIDKGKNCSPIHMPRWASRLTLEITGVRVERLQDIQPKDAIAEGFMPDRDSGIGTPEGFRAAADMVGGPYPRGFFAVAWDEINGKKHPWSSNPWVWAIEFKKCS